MVRPPPAFPELYPTCPIEFLPEPLRSAAKHAIQKMGVPAVVALTDAVAAAAAVVHCGYDCITPEGETMPATINTCAVAPSATGKGRSIKVFFAHFLQAQKKRNPRVVERGQHGNQANALRKPIVEAMMNKVSYRALMEELDGDGMNVTIQREEGASFLATDLFKQNTDAIAQLWSGDPPLDHFVHGTELIAAEARGSLGFRIQPDLMYEYLKDGGRLAYKLGFWPRTIAGCHDPDRFPWNENYQPFLDQVANPAAFHRRMEELAMQINDRNSSGFAGRIGVKLDTDATAFILELGYRMKQWLRAYYAEIREAAGRAWENTLRIAVVLHVFCVGNGPVSRETIERAWAIVEWSLSQHRLIFVEAIRPLPKPMKPVKQPKLPPHQQRLNADMQFMLDALGTRAPFSPAGKVPLAEILLLTGLSKTRFLKALGWLVAGCYVVVDGVNEHATVLLLPHPPIGLRFG